ncbi:MAG: hypothetical protein LAP38_17605 [Acidobacteriia bacterium]|nr:hypothetical protein [Terriglobia bacterium]
MGKRCRTGREDVASLATLALAAHRAGRKAELRKEVARTEALARDMDACEAEKMDVLMGAIESLECSRPEPVLAALHLLEHLAQGATGRPRR